MKNRETIGIHGNKHKSKIQKRKKNPADEKETFNDISQLDFLGRS